MNGGSPRAPWPSAERGRGFSLSADGARIAFDAAFQNTVHGIQEVVAVRLNMETDEIRAHPERTTVPFIYVDAVVLQPYGAYPTSTYGHYNYDAIEITAYQDAARTGSPAIDEYLRRWIWGCATFDDYLAQAAGQARLRELRRTMQELL